MDVEEVTLVRWPGEEARLDALRAAGEPRLVVVETGSPTPAADCLEDWLRAPVDVDELRIRTAALRSRARHHVAATSLDDDGLLRRRGQIVALPPVQQSLAAALLERPGSVVGRDALARRAWPDGAPRDRNVLDVHITRLRRQLEKVGLELRTVRRRGYLLRDLDCTQEEAG
jgi:DNA-binding response OmpR family regulator